MKKGPGMRTARAVIRAAGILAFAAGMAAPAPPVGEPLSVTIGAKPLVKDTMRFGINLGSDAYYSGAALVKKRVCENFEGTSYRQIYWGPVWKDNGLGSWFGAPDSWRPILIGAQYTILCGPNKGLTGKIKDITRIPYKNRDKDAELTFFELDRKIQPAPGNGALMLEAIRLAEGDFRKLDGHWTSADNKIVTGDVPPGSFGCAALCLDATKAAAHVRFATHFQQYGQTNGTWHLSFWAKGKSGAPTLTVGPSPREYGPSRQAAVDAEWKKHELTLVVDNVPEPGDAKSSPHLTWLLEAAGGEVLIDDVEAWMEGETNPTVFRDDCVETLKKYSPGVIRRLQMGGNTLDNCLQPPLRAHAFTSCKTEKPGPYEKHGRAPYSLHEMCELCEFLGAEPWHCLPGTLTQQEMRNFMEYLGAPADVGYGRIRAQLGHPKPWTEVFQHIHVEFGNEAWNNAAPYQCGGFNGPDYWQGLIAAGKASPYCQPGVLFHAAGQAASPGLNARIMKDAPNADRFAVAPYLVQSLSKAEAAQLDTDDKLFGWAFAWPILRSRESDGAMLQNWHAAQAANLELSVYEVNHHITHGDGPLEPRNRITTSIGGALNVVNDMLLMLKEHHIRTQCFFTLIQHSYEAKDVGAVRLWGAALNMRKGQERYRPTFLACALANKVLGGDLVQTVHSPGEPKFSATGLFHKQGGAETVADLPTVFSYAFADGKRRAVILINLDTSKAHPVTLEFDGQAQGATATGWLLCADKISAGNEFENAEPQVKIAEREFENFGGGATVTLPPFSMQAIQWTAE